MKPFLSIILLLFTVCRVAIAGDQVQIMRDGKGVDAAQAESLASNIAALLESCTVRLTSQEVSPKTWDSLLHSNSFIHVTFSLPGELKVMDGQNMAAEKTSVQEILLPLPTGEYPAVYIRTPGGLFAFTKYYPGPFKKVISEQVLGLSAVPPYDQIIARPEIK